MEPKDNMYGGYIDLANYDPLTTVLPSSGNGLWSQINTTSNSIRDPYADLYARIDKLELNEKLLRLKILGLEGKFSQDEIKNIRAMLMSNDEASITLANTIIETA